MKFKRDKKDWLLSACSENYLYCIGWHWNNGNRLNLFSLIIYNFKKNTHQYIDSCFDELRNRKFKSIQQAKKFADKFERKNKGGWFVPPKTIKERQEKKKLEVIFFNKALEFSKNMQAIRAYMDLYKFCMYCDFDKDHFLQFESNYMVTK